MYIRVVSVQQRLLTSGVPREESTLVQAELESDSTPGLNVLYTHSKLIVYSLLFYNFYY